MDGTLTRGKLLLVDLAGSEVRHLPTHIFFGCTAVAFCMLHVPHYKLVCRLSYLTFIAVPSTLQRVKESHVAGTRMTEACAVNRSLSALGNVIEALSAKAAHVPYRDSKLTMILQDVLRSDSSCKMLVLVTVSPLLHHAQQTCDALKFGARCRRVELGRAAQDLLETHEQQQRKREAELGQRLRRRRSLIAMQAAGK